MKLLSRSLKLQHLVSKGHVIGNRKLLKGNAPTDPEQLSDFFYVSTTLKSPC